MKKEIEATFLSIDKDDMRSRLQKAGFSLEYPEYLMVRKTFDVPAENGATKWGRVRQEFNKITMTVKEVRGSGIDDTYEAEVVVDNFNEACAILKMCGVKEKAFQESYREAWQRDGVEITIDTWPGLDPIIEIEAETEEIVRSVAAELGFDFNDAVFGSIDIVYEKELGISSKEIIGLSEITFLNPPRKKA